MADNSERSENLKDYIIEALFSLMETRDYKSITITDIVQKAGVCRSTFYRYFDTKEDVITSYFMQAVSDFSEGLGHNFAPRTEDGCYSLILQTCNAVKASRRRMSALMNSHLDFMYLDFLNEMFSGFFDGRAYPNDTILPYAYAGMLYNVSKHWVQEDCATPAEDVAGSMFAAMFGHEHKPA